MQLEVRPIGQHRRQVVDHQRLAAAHRPGHHLDRGGANEFRALLDDVVGRQVPGASAVGFGQSAEQCVSTRARPSAQRPAIGSIVHDHDRRRPAQLIVVGFIAQEFLELNQRPAEQPRQPGSLIRERLSRSRLPPRHRAPLDTHGLCEALLGVPGGLPGLRQTASASTAPQASPARSARCRSPNAVDVGEG